MNEIKKYQGGMPLTMEDLIFMQDAYKESFSGSLSYIGNCRLSGIVLTKTDIGGGDSNFSVTAGILLLNGEVLPCIAQNIVAPSSYNAYLIVEEALSGQKEFYDSSVRQVRATRKTKLIVQSDAPSVGFLLPGLTYTDKLKDLLGLNATTVEDGILLNSTTGFIKRIQSYKMVTIFGVIRNAIPVNRTEWELCYFGYNAPPTDIYAPLVNSTGRANGSLKINASNSTVYMTLADGEYEDHYFNFSYIRP